MAILKHLTSKSSDYGAALDYLMFQHDEKTGRELRDRNGSRIPREEFYLDGINCEPFAFDLECKQLNQAFHKNQNCGDVKSHHYIISFDPRDVTECGLDGKQAQAIGLEFANRFFVGHQILVCTHMDGNNKSGNIHVHIVLNSLRKLDVELQPFMERSYDSRAGYKHHQTRELLTAMQKGLMEITEREGLHQIDLLSPAAVKITEKEYRKEKRGQEKLEELNARIIADGMKPRFTKFQTDLQKLRDVISDCAASACSYEELQKSLQEKYGITLKESRGRFGYLLPDRERYITVRRLGADFKKEHILSVLEKNAKTHMYDPGYDYESDPVAILFIRSKLRLVTDLQTCVKAQQSQAYAQKVKLANLKEMAKTVCYIQENGFDTRDDLNVRLEEIQGKLQEAQQTFHDTEDHIQTLNEQIHYVGQYVSNKAVKAEFLKAKNKKQFREQHGTELDLYETAVKYIKENMNAQVPLLKELKAQRDQLLQMKKAQRGIYKYFQEYEKELRTVCANVDAILAGTATQNTQVAETVLPPKSPERTSVLERLRKTSISLRHINRARLRERKSIRSGRPVSFVIPFKGDHFWRSLSFTKNLQIFLPECLQFRPLRLGLVKGGVKMNRTNYKTTYYTRETELAGFAPFPHYLLKLELSMTARVLYSQLLNRAKLSLQSGWMDECGRVYVYFSEAEIGQTLGKGRSAVQQALHDLDEADLIERERYAGRGGRRIYLKVVLAETEEDRKPASTIPENRTSPDRIIGPGGIGKPAPRNYTEKPKVRNHTEKAKSYGRYENVFLSDEQLHVLREAYPDDLDRYIEELSVYLKANGKTYHDYEAGIRKWAANDRKKKAVSQPERDYSYDGEDSL